MRDQQRGLGRVAQRAVVALASALIATGTLAAIGEGGALADARDGGGDGGDASTLDASAKIPPDPPALAEKMQWVFHLRWERGEVYLVAVHKVDMGSSHPTPRMMGRFAIELFEGPTLIERARFDFPMLGSVEVADAGWKTPPRFEPKLKTRIGVFFPATKRGTRLELWDRATGRRWPLPWPPVEGTYGDGADAAAAVAARP